jgi:hypothetical protein
VSRGALVLAVLLLSGCFTSSTDPARIEFAIKACEPHGGLRLLEIPTIGPRYAKAYCRNGVSVMSGMGR